jgi:GNAT superfamily N-acetyltransferase
MRGGREVGSVEATIRRPRHREGERLREIAIASKSHWGYDLERVRQWAALGDFSPEGLREKEFFVVEVSGEAVGWTAIAPRGEVCWLDDLWISPEWMGRGLGRLLFQRAAARGLELGASRIEWEAEPHAIGFYEKMGGRYLRDSEHGIWGRVNAVMGVDLSQAAVRFFRGTKGLTSGLLVWRRRPS